MKIAELFVDLGVKGDGSAKKALEGVDHGLGGIRTMATETKVAILAAVYAVQQMMSHSMGLGTSLNTFTQFTGESAQELQRWQYALKMAGGTAEEMTSAVEGLQSKMTQALYEGNAPKGLQQVIQSGVDFQFDEEHLKKPFYVIEKMREYLKKEKNIGLANEVAGSFGLSPALIGALRSGALDQEKLNAAPVLSQGQVSRLHEVDTATKKLQNKIEMAFGKFTAKHGLEIVNDISQITGAVFELAEALVVLAEKMQIFPALGKAVSFAAKLIESGGKITKDISSVFENGNPISPEVIDWTKKAISKTKNAAEEYGDKFSKTLAGPTDRAFGGGTQNNNVNNNIVVNNHGVSGAEEGAHHFKRELSKTVNKIGTKNRAN